MGSTKELHFFDNESIFAHSKVKYSLYEKEFDFSTRKKVYGEATPIYLYWQPCAQRIYEYNPAIKLVAMLRNPIERAFSNWNMEYDRQHEREDFSFCIRNEDTRVKDQGSLQSRLYAYVARGYYAAQIQTYRKYFRNDQMLFVKYENFKEHQERELLKILNFIGVNPDEFSFEYKIVYQLPSHGTITSEDRSFLIKKFTPDVRAVEAMLGWDCADWLI